MSTAVTPGIAFALDVSMPVMSACAWVAAHDRHVLHARELQVVDVAALAGEELLVLLAVDGLPDALRLLGCDRHHTVTPAADRTAATMFS